jgi:hypothetical protein
MTISDLNFLRSVEGRAMLQSYSGYTDDQLFKLLFKSAKQADLNFLSAAVTLIRLRRSAGEKFSRSAVMFFTTLGLEQATGEKIADHIAARFAPDWSVADLTCGIGGNLISLAKRCRRVIGVDRNGENVACAQENITLYGLQDKTEIIVGDAHDHIKPGIDAFFLDPARDREGQTKTRSIINSEPPLLEILPSIFAITKNVGVKISPAFDYQELDLLPEAAEVEIISENNNCKVAMLWFGALKRYERSASCFVSDRYYSHHDNPASSAAIVTDRIGAYLYEPNKAISRARLLDEIAAEYGLQRVSGTLAFLTGDQLVASDKPGLLRTFSVVASGDFAAKSFSKFLHENKVERADVIAKDFPMKPEEILKRFKLKEGGGSTLIFLTSGSGKRRYILAKNQLYKP